MIFAPLIPRIFAGTTAEIACYLSIASAIRTILISSATIIFRTCNLFTSANRTNDLARSPAFATLLPLTHHFSFPSIRRCFYFAKTFLHLMQTYFQIFPSSEHGERKTKPQYGHSTVFVMLLFLQYNTDNSHNCRKYRRNP